MVEGAAVWCVVYVQSMVVFRGLCMMKHKLESRLSGDISITSDMQMASSLWQKAKKN